MKTFVPTAAALLAAATPLLGQAAPRPVAAPSGAVASAPATPPALTGPLVPAVCLLSPESVIAGSKVGQAVKARLEALTLSAQMELDTERAPLEAEQKSLATPGVSLPPGQLQQRQQALDQRLTSFRAKTDLRSRELAATRNKAVGQIGAELQPLVGGVYARHGCGLLLRREMALGGNFGNDLTPELVQALDAKMTALPPFEREHLATPAPQGAGQP